MVRSILSGMSLAPFAYRMVRWHWRYLWRREPTPLSGGIHITSCCNLRCSFCNLHRIRPSFTVSERDAREWIRQLADAKHVYFGIGGGEPLLVPYVFDLLGLAKGSGIPYTHLVTNGILLDEACARAAAEAKVSEISISLDGPPEVHDALRGLEGAYVRVLGAVEMLHTYAPRTRIVLNAILEPAHPEWALHAAQVARGLGVLIKIQPRNDHPVFDLAEPAAPRVTELTPEEQRNLRSAIDSLSRMRHVSNSRPFFRNYLHFLFSRDRLAFVGKDCILPYHHIEIFNNQAFPCLEGMNYSGGFRLEERGLHTMMTSSSYRDVVNSLRKCEGCLRNYYVCYYEPRLSFPLWNLLYSRCGRRV